MPHHFKSAALDYVKIKRKTKNKHLDNKKSRLDLSPEDRLQLEQIENELARRRRLFNPNLTNVTFSVHFADDSEPDCQPIKDHLKYQKPEDSCDNLFEPDSGHSSPENVFQTSGMSKIHNPDPFPILTELLRSLHLEQDFVGRPESRSSSYSASSGISTSDQDSSVVSELELKEEKPAQSSSTVLPISLFHPELLVRQKREQDALRRGCYFEQAPKPNSMSVGKEKMALLKVSSKQRAKDELKKKKNDMHSDRFQIIFCTTDSFKKPDKI